MWLGDFSLASWREIYIKIITNIWRFPDIGGTPIPYHLNMVFHEINHPAIGVPPWLWKPPDARCDHGLLYGDLLQASIADGIGQALAGHHPDVLAVLDPGKWGKNETSSCLNFNKCGFVILSIKTFVGISWVCYFFKCLGLETNFRPTNHRDYVNLGSVPRPKLQLPDPSQPWGPWGRSPSAPVPCWKRCGTAGAPNTKANCHHCT